MSIKHISIWFPLLLVISILIQCNPKEEREIQNPTLKKILDAHGGLQQWDNQNTLQYTLGNQEQTIDLKSRNVKITAPDYTMGSSGDTVWIMQDTASFKGSPRFYHNLMFYFHSVPFVFADKGIHYEKVADKEIEGHTYGGLKISFDEGVGDASKDQYIIYYDTATLQMKWLAYNSTYSSQKKSDKYNLIKYATWEKVNGLLLPSELQWYEYENGEVGSPRGNPRLFSGVSLSDKHMGAGFYKAPDGAELDVR